MGPIADLPLSISLALICSWLVIAALGAGFHDRLELVRALFPIGALVSLALAGVALVAMAGPAFTLVLPLGLPDLPFHLRLDALNAFFLALLGLTSFGISLFAAGYFRAGQGTSPGLMCLQYHSFLASMALVLLADDAYLFMVAWETMALSSFFLVTTEHRLAEIRRAGFLYLLIAHIGAIAILLCFGVLQGGSGDYTFDGMRTAQLNGIWPSIGFFLALFGFGAKAGMLPLHVWLPEAHPAAPSPVSALMSGVMLKTAIYGLLRVCFDLLHTELWWWGAVALGLGLLTALYGVIFATVQTDMKRLLAYSSIENIGLIIAGLGLAMVFRSFNMPQLAALALTATLLHCLNHALFKSLLFLATGSVLHATRERSLGKLGGLIHRMPWVAWLALIGTLAIAGVPPLNGFVSEWMLLQAFLFTSELPQGFINMLIPIAAASLALTAALAAYTMVKFYGVIFLGQPRELALKEAHDAGPRERLGLAWLAAWCVILGLFPASALLMLEPVNEMLLGRDLGALADNWLFIAPINADRASFSPLITLAGISFTVLGTIFLVHRLYHRRLRRGPAWDCGFPLQTARMQDSAEGFGQPIRQIFEAFFRVTRSLPTPFDKTPSYAVKVEDHLWYWFYRPVAKAAEFLTWTVGFLQQGRISVYLLYSFFTLIALLLFVR